LKAEELLPRKVIVPSQTGKQRKSNGKATEILGGKETKKWVS
jgi:hypothetical protein